jgi:hypothetical protein
MRAYLIKNVEGDGDTRVKIVDEATFNYVLSGGTMPASQRAAQMAKIAEWQKRGICKASDVQAEIDDLDDDLSSRSYADQERAMQVVSTDFNGAVFNKSYASTKEIMDFLNANGLTLVDEFQGLSW